MKKLKRIIALIVILTTVTGCVKMEISMDIKNDKSMTFGIIQAIDKSLMEQSGGNTSILEEEEKRELEEDGYTVEPYTENSMEGYKITKEIKSIDEVSTESEITADLGSSELSDNEYLFTVKKGLFKNTYTAKLKSTDTDEINDSIDSQLEDDSIYEDTDTITDESDYYTDDEYTDSSLDNYDYSALMSSLDIKMKVNLPHKALSNNATTVENDGKTLIWDFTEFQEETIEFKFEIYNTSNIIIAVVIGVVVILLIIILIVKNSNNKKQSTNNIPAQNNYNPLSQGQNITPPQSSIENTNINQPMINNPEMSNNNIINQPTNNMSAQNNYNPLSQEQNIMPPQSSIENTNINQPMINNPEMSNNNIAPTNNTTFIQKSNAMPSQMQEENNNTINQSINNLEPTNNINNIPNVIPSVPLIKPEVTNQINNNISTIAPEITQVSTTTPNVNVSANQSLSQSYDIFTTNLNNQTQSNPNSNQSQNQNVQSTNSIFPEINTNK